MDQLLIAVYRKLVFIAILLLSYLLLDRGVLHGFSTPEVLKHDPKAIALLLGMLSLAVAIA